MKNTDKINKENKTGKKNENTTAAYECKGKITESITLWLVSMDYYWIMLLLLLYMILIPYYGNCFYRLLWLFPKPLEMRMRTDQAEV